MTIRSSDREAWLPLLSRESDLKVEGAGAGGVELSPSSDSLSERLGAKDNLFFYNKHIIKKIISIRKAVKQVVLPSTFSCKKKKLAGKQGGYSWVIILICCTNPCTHVRDPRALSWKNLIIFDPFLREFPPDGAPCKRLRIQIWSYLFTVFCFS